jgi:hypothetical protein
MLYHTNPIDAGLEIRLSDKTIIMPPISSFTIQEINEMVGFQINPKEFASALEKAGGFSENYRYYPSSRSIRTRDENFVHN